MDLNLYQGNSLFRNQPSFKMFNKSFEHVDDTLFTFLNEVESEILKQEQEVPSHVFTSYRNTFTRTDPRTQTPINLSVFDHSTQQLGYHFPNPQERCSTLTTKQQSACLRVLLAWQRNLDVSEDDFVEWRATNNKRCTEQQEVQTYIYEYVNEHRERLHAPMKRLVLQYGKWYQLKVQQISRTLPDISYTTHSGLPQLSQCKSLFAQSASMNHVQLLSRAGQVRLWPEVHIKQQELSTLRVRLERYVCADEASEHDAQYLATELDKQLQHVDEDVYLLPVDSLLMLLTAGAYVDLPTEMLLDIREIPNSGHKYIKFHEPIPARNCGWHTNSQLLNQTYTAFAPAEWLQLNPDTDVLMSDKINKQSKSTLDYKLLPIEDVEQTVAELKTNGALVSWRLCTDHPEDSEESEDLLVFSTLTIPAVRDAKAQHPLGCHLIKLESKPDCGCEIMSKYELLSCWLQLQLLQANVGHCTRISLSDFELLLDEQLTLDSLEKQLQKYYHVSMSNLLCQLLEFLKLLKSISPGEYLLRYTAKYRDKFLLCRSTLEATPQCFKLKDLIDTTPSDVTFLTENNNYLPISDTLCSRMHEELQLLPCTFPPNVGKAHRSRRKPTQTRIESKPALVQRTRKRIDKKTPAKKNSKRKRKLAAAKVKQQQEQEQKTLENIMIL